MDDKCYKKKINEVTKYDRMADPDDPSYEEGWDEYRKGYKSMPAAYKSWDTGFGRDRYTDKKTKSLYGADMDENYAVVKDIINSYVDIPLEDVNLDDYCGISISSGIKDSYIILDKVDCNGSATVDAFQESIDRAKNKFEDIVAEILENLPHRGQSPYSLKSDKYGSYGRNNQPRSLFYKDAIDKEFRQLRFQNRSVMSLGYATNADEFRSKLDDAPYIFGGEKEYPFLGRHKENTFDNHVTGWVIVAELNPRDLLRGEDSRGEIKGLDVQVGVKYDDDYRQDYEDFRNQASGNVHREYDSLSYKGD